MDLEIGSEERAAELGGVHQSQLIGDVAGDGLGCGGGEREHGNPETGLQSGEVAIGGSEVVTPLADAMCLVDGDQAEVDAVQRPPDGRLDALGGGVHQFVPAAPHPGDPIGAFVRTEARVEEGGSYPYLVQAIHLILHERDQG